MSAKGDSSCLLRISHRAPSPHPAPHGVGGMVEGNIGYLNWERSRRAPPEADSRKGKGQAAPSSPARFQAAPLWPGAAKPQTEPYLFPKLGAELGQLLLSCLCFLSGTTKVEADGPQEPFLSGHTVSL